jgi:hypothetical protein
LLKPECIVVETAVRPTPISGFEFEEAWSAEGTRFFAVTFRDGSKRTIYPNRYDCFAVDKQILGRPGLNPEWVTIHASGDVKPLAEFN